jgi:hypothetical protein
MIKTKRKGYASKGKPPNRTALPSIAYLLPCQQAPHACLDSDSCSAARRLLRRPCRLLLAQLRVPEETAALLPHAHIRLESGGSA